MFVTAAAFATATVAQTESVIHSFPSGNYPYARLSESATGILYGTTYYGGNGYGDVFQLRQKRGVWSEHSIYAFNGGNDGQNPFASLTQDASGNFYGTTRNGGDDGLGTAFSLTPAGRSWSESIIHTFSGGSDGDQPLADLSFDTATGVFYGTTSSGKEKGACGTVFELSPSGGGWTETTLYSFQGGTDGCTPQTAVHKGTKEGNLIGSTTDGGHAGDGTVFMLAERNGVWSESVLYSFSGGSDGAHPGDLDINSKDGSVFGVAAGGGARGAGVVFELSQVKRHWRQSVIHSFGLGIDGKEPVGIHLEESTGTLYGSTTYGGTNDYGSVFKLTPNGSSWTESILHSFGTTTGDGLYPESRPIEDPTTGALYGTTSEGGQYGGGAVWTISP